MDWISWLSKTSLESSLVYEYGLAFSHNELEEEDIEYFNHEFLQSLGISIGKHRLEIFKLVQKEKKRSKSNARSGHLSRILVAVKRTKKYIQTWIPQKEDKSKALVVVPIMAPRYGSRWVKRSNKEKAMVVNKEGGLLIENEKNGPIIFEVGMARNRGFSSTTMEDVRNEVEMNGGDDAGDEKSSMNGVEKIRWDAMFQDLKPT